MPQDLLYSFAILGMTELEFLKGVQSLLLGDQLRWVSVTSSLISSSWRSSSVFLAFCSVSCWLSRAASNFFFPVALGLFKASRAFLHFSE